MSRKLTLDITFMEIPRDGDKFGYQISNNGVPLSFNGFLGWDKTFKDATDYSITNVGIMSFEYDLNPNVADNAAIGNGFNGPVSFIKRQSSGKYICVGDFTMYQSQAIRYICRLNTDFTLDNTFIPPYYGSYIRAIEVDGSDNIYIGSVNNIGGKLGLQRLGINGVLDTTYISGAGFNGEVTCLKLQSDGKLLVAGNFTTFNGTTSKGLIRLLSTGVSDSFGGITTGFITVESYIRSIDLQSTGNIVVGGDFVSYNSTTCGNIIILTPTGAIANVPVALSNLPGVIVGNVVNKVLVDSSDKIYATGKFEIYGGTNVCHKIIRLNSNGTYDSTFVIVNNGLQNGSSVFSTGGYDMIFNGSENLAIVGSFTELQNTTVPNIGTLGSTGSISPDGETTAGTLSYYTDVIIRNIIDTGSGYIIVGDFDSYTTPNVGPVSSQFIIPISPTFSNNVYNTYNNLVEFNSGYGITYSVILFDTIVRMEYTFDDQEVVINSVYDTPDYVEITFLNESLTLPELVKEVVVRSPYLIISNAATFSYVNYKVKVYEGSIFDGPSQPITYDITKSKLFDGQENIYVNLNNLIREKLEANVTTFVDDQYENAQPLPENMSKRCLVDETIFNGSVTASTAKYYLLALDGFLYNNEEQGVPNVLITGTKRYIHRNQAQRIYFQSNFLTDIKISMDSNGTFNTLSFDSTDILGDNKKYIQSLQVDTQYFTNDNQHVDYLFTYSNSDMVIVRFEIYEDCKYKLYNVVYKNKWGVLESIPFSKKSTRGIDVKGVDFERSILDYNGNYDITRHTSKQFNVNASESWVLNTDWMPEYMNAAFEELGLSEEIWIITDTNEIIPVIKEDTRIDFKTALNDKLIQYTLKVKLSHQVIKNIL